MLRRKKRWDKNGFEAAAISIFFAKEALFRFIVSIEIATDADEPLRVILGVGIGRH